MLRLVTYKVKYLDTIFLYDMTIENISRIRIMTPLNTERTNIDGTTFGGINILDGDIMIPSSGHVETSVTQVSSDLVAHLLEEIFFFMEEAKMNSNVNEPLM